jgi:hypothetical protein
MKRTLKVLKIAAVSLALLYLGDYLSVRFQIPNRRELLTSVQIEVYYAVKLKGQKTEFMRADPEMETCVRSLFPQIGYLPCWYVTRHMTKWVEVGQTIVFRRLSAGQSGVPEEIPRTSPANPSAGQTAG